METTATRAVRRPQNCFILYRNARLHAAGSDLKGKHMHDVSKIVGTEWKNMTDEEKDAWYTEQKKVADKHKEDNPGWHYQPGSTKAEKEERKRLRKTRTVTRSLTSTSIRETGKSKASLKKSTCSGSSAPTQAVVIQEAPFESLRDLQGNSYHQELVPRPVPLNEYPFSHGWTPPVGERIQENQPLNPVVDDDPVSVSYINMGTNSQIPLMLNLSIGDNMSMYGVSSNVFPNISGPSQFSAPNGPDASLELARNVRNDYTVSLGQNTCGNGWSASGLHHQPDFPIALDQIVDDNSIIPPVHPKQIGMFDRLHELYKDGNLNMG